MAGKMYDPKDVVISVNGQPLRGLEVGEFKIERPLPTTARRVLGNVSGSFEIRLDAEDAGRSLLDELNAAAERARAERIERRAGQLVRLMAAAAYKVTEGAADARYWRRRPASSAMRKRVDAARRWVEDRQGPGWQVARQMADQILQVEDLMGALTINLDTSQVEKDLETWRQHFYGDDGPGGRAREWMIKRFPEAGK